MTAPKTDDQYLTRQEAADYIRSTYGTLSTWASTNRHNLRPIRMSRGKVLYRKRYLDEYLDRKELGLD